MVSTVAWTQAAHIRQPDDEEDMTWPLRLSLCPRLLEMNGYIKKKGKKGGGLLPVFCLCKIVM